MYLKTCWLENTGPIEKFEIEMPFHTDGRPKPVVLVGSNGTGKTMVLSYIADALVEIAKKEFQDVVLGQGHNSPYLRMIGAGNQKIGASYSFAHLSFETGAKSAQKFFYREQNGKAIPPQWDEECQNRFQRKFPWKEGAKEIDDLPNNFAAEVFDGKSNCFFPFNRFERPHWHNSEITEQINSFDLGKNLQKRLGTKPIVVIESSVLNLNWLMHVYLDSRVDFVPILNGNQIQYQLQGDGAELLLRQKGLHNVVSVIRQILRDPDLQLGLMPRTHGLSRICISKNGAICIPSLEHLSAGQAILLNIFLTIIRYSDRDDASKAQSLDQIQGIVLIDEIDAHLHSDLQYDVLPKLIKLFPKVQFIMTSHAPLFVLGMEREFGDDGYLLLDMPNGKAISAERFSEFRQSFEYYEKTKTYEDKQRENLCAELEKRTKPLVLTEGDTDRDYLKAALELSGNEKLASEIDIEWIGNIANGQAISGGDRALNNAYAFLSANPEFLADKRVMLLYDCDTNKPITTQGNLWVRTLPQSRRSEIRKGIENLLPSMLITTEDRRFYKTKEETTLCGEKRIIESLLKRDLCDFICKERRNADDFVAFDCAIKILQNFADDAGISSDENLQNDENSSTK